MREMSMDEVKKVQFEMLQYAKKICDENDIKYYLAYGTLLGAVRHKGFIPWDDDIDISLMRSEYERFIKAVENDHHKYIRIVHMKNSKNYFGPYAMLVDTRTMINHFTLKEYLIDGLGVYIDVFPLDQFDDLELLKSMLKKSHQLKALNNLTMVKTFANDKGVKKIAKMVVAPFANLIGHKALCEKTEKLAEAAKKENGKYVVDLMWDPQMRWCIPVEAYADTVQLEFEGETFSAPKEYDLVLRTGYGNYMQFPPEEERVTGHNYVFYWNE